MYGLAEEIEKLKKNKQCDYGKYLRIENQVLKWQNKFTKNG